MTPALIYNELHRVWEIHYVSANNQTHWAKSQFKNLLEAHRKMKELEKIKKNENINFL